MWGLPRHESVNTCTVDRMEGTTNDRATWDAPSAVAVNIPRTQHVERLIENAAPGANRPDADFAALGRQAP
jgi:hypothetical protein